MSKEEKKDKPKIKKPINKMKIAQIVIILILVGSMLFSTAIALIYNIIGL